MGARFWVRAEPLQLDRRTDNADQDVPLQTADYSVWMDSVAPSALAVDVLHPSPPDQLDCDRVHAYNDQDIDDPVSSSSRRLLEAPVALSYLHDHPLRRQTRRKSISRSVSHLPLFWHDVGLPTLGALEAQLHARPPYNLLRMRVARKAVSYSRLQWKHADFHLKTSTSFLKLSCHEFVARHLALISTRHRSTTLRAPQGHL